VRGLDRVPLLLRSLPRAAWLDAISGTWLGAAVLFLVVGFSRPARRQRRAARLHHALPRLGRGFRPPPRNRPGHLSHLDVRLGDGRGRVLDALPPLRSSAVMVAPR